MAVHLVQRKWKCQSNECNYFDSDKFTFVDKNRRITNATDILIVQAFKDFNLTARQIARKFNVTDTYALNTFDRYVEMPRLKLPTALCIDEVDIGKVSTYKYALVLQDFVSGEPIDLVVSRRQSITEPYFSNIPKDERFKVKYIISDMYAPYQNYIDTYFPHALPVVDSFHVIKLINQKLNSYLIMLRNKFRERDKKNFEERQSRSNYPIKQRESKELYLLRTKKWILLANTDNIDYDASPFRDWRFGNALMHISDYQQELYKLDSNIEDLHNLKELYIRFNRECTGDIELARIRLDEIISIYSKSRFQLFKDVAKSLIKYKQAIINSFILVNRTYKSGKEVASRLSNGPMESLNRIPKDMKRHTRGFLNFDHLRNRFLYSSRNNAAILAVPKPISEAKNVTGKTRGPYKKN